MKKMLVDFANGLLMLLGMLAFLAVGQELEGALGFWIKFGGMMAFLIGLDWRIKSAIRVERDRLSSRYEGSL